MLDSSLVFCTLLGPEGPGSFAGRVAPKGADRGLGAHGPLDLVVSDEVRCTRCRPYFENYTVDASILDSNRKVRIT